MTYFALGWEVGALTGWGQFGAHFARTASNAGHKVVILGSPRFDGVLALDRPLIQKLIGPLPDGPGWLCMAIGNACEAKPDGLPNGVRTCGIIFCEDTGALDVNAVARLNAYDVIVAGSSWTERVLREKGVERVILCHQGYDSRVFYPHVTVSGQTREALEHGVRAEKDGFIPAPPLGIRQKGVTVFSGGKLEFRKGQDIVVEAFKRFRLTLEGKDAVLVIAWDNQWPQTMDGIWLSGYVKGLPTVRHGRADFVSWLEANGLPREAVIDCGRMTPTEAAHVMRSCDVGIFPNRAESGTNLVLVEALASGLPCIVNPRTGHRDVVNGCGPEAITVVSEAGVVPAGCKLYSSVDEWSEMSPSACSMGLQLTGDVGQQRSFDSAYWSWETRGPALAEAIIEMSQQVHKGNRL